MSSLTPGSNRREKDAARDRYDTAKFTDREIEETLEKPGSRSEAYLAALRAERDRRSAAQGQERTPHPSLEELRAMTGEELDAAQICRRCWEPYTVCVCSERKKRPYA